MSILTTAATLVSTPVISLAFPISNWLIQRMHCLKVRKLNCDLCKNYLWRSGKRKWNLGTLTYGPANWHWCTRCPTPPHRPQRTVGGNIIGCGWPMPCIYLWRFSVLCIREVSEEKDDKREGSKNKPAQAQGQGR